MGVVPTGTLPAPLPDRIKREGLPSGLRLSYRWFGPASIFLLVFCVFWDGFLVNWYAMAGVADVDWTRGLAGIPPERRMFLLFPLLHVAAGAGITYYTLCTLLNRTVIDIERGELRVRIGPLPWRGNHTVPAQAIAQLYREEIVRRGKNGQTVTYQVSAALKDGSKVKLVSGLTAADQALYLEQEIERHLGIRDQPVAGEMRK